MMKKLIILDFFLRDNRGHDEQYDFSLALEALRQGIETELWCAVRSNSHQPEFVKQRLNSPFRGNKGWIGKIATAITRTFDFRDIFQRQALNENTLILIPSIDSHFLLALSIGTVGLEIKPKVIIILRKGLKDHFETLGYFSSKVRSLMTNPFMKYLCKRKNVSFFSDSELITEELKDGGFIDAETLPIPHLPPRGKRIFQQDKIVIGYFGGGRYSKGFDILPIIIRKVLDNHGDVYFIVQAFNFNNAKEIDKAIKEIHGIMDSYPDNIEIIDRYISNDEYQGHMGRCSIVLIPYRKEFYGKGTSGILAEAIACGAWAIVPSGTWMAAQKTAYSKIVTFDTYNAEALVDAINLCIGNEKNIDIKKVNEQINKWYSFHSPTNYVDIILSLYQKNNSNIEIG